MCSICLQKRVHVSGRCTDASALKCVSAHLDSLVCMSYLFVNRCKHVTGKQEAARLAHTKNILHLTRYMEYNRLPLKHIFEVF